MVELSAEARQGDSGGPIFNQKGELAGVLFGSGPGYTSGSYGGRVLQFLTTVVPGGVPGNDGQAPTTALAAQPIVSPPQATALHQPVVPGESPHPPANRLPNDVAAMTPAGSMSPGSLLAPPPIEAVSERFGEPAAAGDEVDPRAAVNLDRYAANTPLTAADPIVPLDENPGPSGLLHSSLPPRGGAATPPGSNLSSAPPDQLLAAIWNKIGGPSAVDQVKTVLAGIGVLGLLLLFWRMGRRSEPEVEAD
jgi:hypothetical protein